MTTLSTGKRKASHSPSRSPPSGTLKKYSKKNETTIVDNTLTEAKIFADTIPFARITTDNDFRPSSMSKIFSWNVAGFRAIMRNWEVEFRNLFFKENPDVVCLQETKLQHGKTENTLLGVVPGYVFYDSFSLKKGYSGTRTYIRNSLPHKVLSFHPTFFNAVPSNFGGISPQKTDPLHLASMKHDEEGRINIIEFPTLVLVNTYVPNAGMELKRLPHRISTWDQDMLKCLQKLQRTETKPVVWLGDLNVAERNYDRYFQGSYAQMQKCAGFTPEERMSFRQILEKSSMIDSFRYLYPLARKAYTFWSARICGRERGLGWRLDYFVLSRSLITRLVDSFMLPQVKGSDHCPIALWLKNQL